jgi:urease accessory protein
MRPIDADAGAPEPPQGVEAAAPNVSRRDCREAADVGRVARMHLMFECRACRTRLASSYAEPPFRVPLGCPDEDSGFHAVVASSAPGIFGGDRFTQVVEVAPGARVHLRSQSAQQVHPSRCGAAASWSADYRVAPGAHLDCVWDPAIPFARARLDQRISIELAGDATLFWSDAIMAGRSAHGERWAFARLAHELRVTRDEQLVYLERYVIDAGDRPVGRAWIADAACYFGTILIVGPPAVTARDTIQSELSRETDVQGVADRPEEGVTLVRLMSTSGRAFHVVRDRIARVAQSMFRGLD